MKLSAMMRAMRVKAGFDQRELATELNLSQSCVSKFETGKKIPSFPQMIHWAEVTNAKELIIAYIAAGDGLTVLQNAMQLITGG
ncbi:helix-turn-helix domain-containing protein [Alkalicoccobacillus plakortidis]|uniref:Helix-turn-helix domain-containing protein n=1 Tax=Alkalicoccobacillus plakortidis TaxID=444060 RepID=A0ABT0XPA8_9BACI|nr:helix-turn-helix transcriptional regulator [Alkalicoccobacillus plakortidis]MCM2677735.1 helix-turn-helix domain-containing protein [Alkalicoccobacillus plakortidis]